MKLTAILAPAGMLKASALLRCRQQHTCEGLDEDLHASTQPEDQVKGGLLLDVVVCQSATVLELLAGKDETLLVGRDPAWSRVSSWRSWPAQA